MTVLCKYLSFDRINCFVTAIDCKWGRWRLGNCTKPCGGGIRINTREKLIIEDNGGICTGKDYDIETCNTINCTG